MATIASATTIPAPLRAGKTGLTLALCSGTDGRVVVVVGTEVVVVEDEVEEGVTTVVRTGGWVVVDADVVAVGRAVVVVEAEEVVVDRNGPVVGVVRLVEGDVELVVEPVVVVLLVVLDGPGLASVVHGYRVRSAAAPAMPMAPADLARIGSV